jgi:hypothetical protein
MFKQHTTGYALFLGLIWVICGAATPAHAAGDAVAAQDPERVTATRDTAIVTLRGRDLFAVAAPLGTLTSAERATSIEQRLLSLADGPPAALASLRLGEEAARFHALWPDSARQSLQ